MYEGIFYLIIPLVYHFKKYYLALSGIFYLAGAFIINIYHPKSILLKFIFEYNFYFAAGIFLNLYNNELIAFLQPKKNKITLIACYTALFVTFNLFALKRWEFSANFLSAFFAVLLIILLLDSKVKKGISVKIFNKLGQVSYSLYLVHIPVLVLCYSIIFRFTNQAIIYSRIYMLGVIVSLLIAFLFYKFIEQPSLALIDRIKLSNKQLRYTRQLHRILPLRSSI